MRTLILSLTLSACAFAQTQVTVNPFNGQLQVTGGLNVALPGNPKGTFNSSTAYSQNDYVSYSDGSNYLCYNVSGCASGVLPTDATKWQLYVKAGSTGAAGTNGLNAGTLTVTLPAANATTSGTDNSIPWTVVENSPHNLTNFTPTGTGVTLAALIQCVDPSGVPVIGAYSSGALTFQNPANAGTVCTFAQKGASAAILPTLSGDVSNSGNVITVQKINGTPASFHGLESATANLKMVVGMLDSLTDGAGGYSYLTALRSILRGHFGDGGPGYEAFDAVIASNMNAGFSLQSSTHIAAIVGQTAGSTPKAYSFEGRGVYCSSTCDGTDKFYFDPQYAYKTATVYYLVSPGACSFRLYHLNQAYASDPTAQTINCNGTLGLGSVTIAADSAMNALQFDTITGANVAIFGANFVLDSTGVVVVDAGAGGQKASEYAQLNATFQQAWYAALTPSVVILNGGMNDRTISTASQLQTSIQSILTPIKAGSVNTSIVLVKQNDSSDSASNNLPTYGPMLSSLASTNGYGFVDEMTLLGGSYAAANAAGLMYDGVHPNTAGDKLRAVNMARYIASGNARDPGATAKPVGTTREGVLASKYFNNVTTSTNQTIYELGVASGYSQENFTITVTSNRNGTSVGTKRTYIFEVSGTGGTAGQVGGVSALSGTGVTNGNTLTWKLLAGDSQDQDFTCTLTTNAASHAVFACQPTGFTQSLYAQGSWVSLYNGGISSALVYQF